MWPVESASGCCSEIPVGKAFASDTVDTILVMEAMEFSSRTLAYRIRLIKTCWCLLSSGERGTRVA